MSVSLAPSSALGFNKPLTVLVKRTLTVTNNNVQPVAFKVKTTAPKLYCVRPNSGRIEPGESVDVSVMLQPMKEDPPTAAKCKDKFLIQSTLITSEKETLPLHDIWNVPEGGEEAKVHQQKLRVVYLPPEGLDEEPLPDAAAEHSIMVGHEDLNDVSGDARYDTVRQPLSNGHVEHNIPEFIQPQPEPELEQTRDIAPNDVYESAPIFATTAEETREEAVVEQKTDDSIVTPPSPPPPAPIPMSVEAPAPTPAPAPVQAPVHDYLATVNAELQAKYKEAILEIERLQALLAAAPDPTSLAPSELPSGVRRRNFALSDDGSSSTYDDRRTYDDRSTYDDRTDVGTMMTEGSTHVEGVPLQVVLIISIGVFITTYLFF